MQFESSILILSSIICKDQTWNTNL